MKFEGAAMILSTGRTECGFGLLSVMDGRNDGDWVLTEGCDGILDTYDKPFTEAENDEIADYMIDLWTRFKAAKGSK